MHRVVASCIGMLLALGIPAVGDEFDAIEGPFLIALTESKAATAFDQITVEQLAIRPRVLSDSRATFFVLRTSDGNLTRLLVSPALRKARTPDRPASPVLLVERFDTFEMPGASNRIASGRDLVLYDGFHFDADTGQVVPRDEGGDLTFQNDGKKGSLAAASGAKLFAFDALPKPSTVPNVPSRGRAVAPADFTGRYRLIANGLWTGELELAVNDDAAVFGKFRSDQTGTAYRVKGLAGDGAANRVTLTIAFPRAEMNLDGLLWTEGKSAFSGKAEMLGRGYGFIAVRTGWPSDPLNLQAPKLVAASPALTVTILASGGWKLGDVQAGETELREAVTQALKDHQAPIVRIQATPETPFNQVKNLIDLLHALGPLELSFELVEP